MRRLGEGRRPAGVAARGWRGEDVRAQSRVGVGRRRRFQVPR